MNTEEMNATQSQAGQRFRDIQQKLGEKAKNYSQVTDQYVHENAWTTIAIAVGIGFLAGFLIGNRD
jgi:ElaB/YqjD/DUF883 family membrane-anchored ribosome-binding protein